MNEIFHIVLEADRIEERSAGFEGHQQVDIAVRVALASRRRAKDAYIGRTATRGQREDLCAVTVEKGVAHGPYSIAQSQREDVQARVRDLETNDRLEAVAEILTDQGFLADVVGSQTGPPRLRIYHCPLCGVVDVCQLPCQAESALLSDLLGARLERETYMPDGDAACTYAVTFSPAVPRSNTSSSSKGH